MASTSTLDELHNRTCDANEVILQLNELLESYANQSAETVPYIPRLALMTDKTLEEQAILDVEAELTTVRHVLQENVTITSTDPFTEVEIQQEGMRLIDQLIGDSQQGYLKQLKLLIQSQHFTEWPE